MVALVLLSASILVVVLALQNRDLRANQQILIDRIRYPYVGLTIPPASAIALNGDTVVIGTLGAARQQLLFFFTVSCEFCLRSLPAWNALADTLAAGNLNALVYGVSLSSEDSTRAFVRAHPLRFPVVRFVDARMRALYRARAVPVAVVVSPLGIYSFTSLGALVTAAVKDSVFRAARMH